MGGEGGWVVWVVMVVMLGYGKDESGQGGLRESV